MCLCQLGVNANFKFCFINFVQQRATRTCFENPSRHKHKRYAQCRGTETVLRALAKRDFFCGLVKDLEKSKFKKFIVSLFSLQRQPFSFKN